MRTILALALLATPAAAQTITFEQGGARFQSQKVEVEIQHRVAVTRLYQLFENDQNRATEGIYTFQVPAGATVMDFAMWINEKQMKGTIYDRETASRVYQSIVNAQRDPGIVEEIADRIFRVRVFPIPAHAVMRFELAYLSLLPYESGACRYVLPLRIPGDAVKELDSFQFELKALAGTRITELSSPSHKLNVSRKSEFEVRASLDKSGELSKDIVVDYKLAEDEADLAFRTHKRSGEDGHFLVVFTPNVLKERALPKEVVYLLDVSASIDPKVFADVKGAILESVKRLNENDTYRVIAFNQEVRAFDGKDLAEWLGKLEIGGRTNLESALQAVTSEKATRPRLVMVVSDGRASAGLLSSESLLSESIGKIDRNTIFFGVRIGPETPERMLETLATATGGDCVAAGDDVAGAIGRIHHRISIPVMTDVSIDWGGAETYGVAPGAMRIVFASDQPMILGRYKKPGTHTVTLRGNVAGRKVEIAKSLEFPGQADGWGSIAHLWGEREIRTTLAAIATHGATNALKNYVIELSKTYRIVTPYTAFLVLENDQMYAQFGLERAIEEERKLFKKKAKRKTRDLSEPGSLDLPSATPGVKPVDPLRDTKSVDTSLLASLKWLGSHRAAWKGVDAGIALNDAGAYALAFLAFTGANDYEIQPADMTALEAAVRDAITAFAAMQDAKTGQIGERKGSWVANHALATWALGKLYAEKRDPRVGERFQKAVAWLCDQQHDDGSWNDPVATAFAILALTEASAEGLELEKDVLAKAEKQLTCGKGPLADALYILARASRGDVAKDDKVKAAAGRLAPKLGTYDPLLAWLGTKALLAWRGQSSREWTVWAKNLEIVMKNAKVAAFDEAKPVMTALRVLVQQAYDSRAD